MITAGFILAIVLCLFSIILIIIAIKLKSISLIIINGYNVIMCIALMIKNL